MKKIIALVLVLCVVITLASCAETGEGTEKILVNFQGISEIDFENGTIRRVCPLEECKHNDENCPFYETSAPVAVGNELYYIRNNEIWHYNMETEEYGRVYSSNGEIEVMFADEGHIFFSEGRDFVKLDLSSGNKTIWDVEMNGKTVDNFYLKVYAVSGGKVYYKIGNVPYSVDYNGENMTKGDKYETADAGLAEAGNYSVSSISYISENVVFVNLDTGEREFVLQSINAYSCANGKVIYTRDDDDNDNAMDREGDVLYMCRPNGTGEEVLCDMRGLLCEMVSDSGAITTIGSGDWVAVKVKQYDYKSNYVDFYEEEEPSFIRYRYLLVNMKTGEFKFAKEA